MLRRLLGVLTPVPCDCGHDAAVHETPCASRRWYACGDCVDLAARPLDRAAARHPYAVRG